MDWKCKVRQVESMLKDETNNSEDLKKQITQLENEHNYLKSENAEWKEKYHKSEMATKDVGDEKDEPKR